MVNIAKTLNSFQVVIKTGRSNLSGHKSVVVKRSHIPDHNRLKVALFVVFIQDKSLVYVTPRIFLEENNLM